MRWPFVPPHLTLKPSKKQQNPKQKKLIQKITHNKTKQAQNNWNNNQNIETWLIKQQQQQQQQVKKKANQQNQKAT